MKKWTDEECFALVEQAIGRVADGFDPRPRDLYPLIRAAVEDARREAAKQTEMMQEALRDKSLNDFQVRVIANLLFDPIAISDEDMKWAQAAILARDKEPRDAER